MLLVKGILGALGQVAVFAAMLLLPAGTWDWPRAIQFLVAYAILNVVATTLLAVANPAGLEARMEAPYSKKQPAADKLATLILILAILGWFVLIPLDVFRLRLLPAPGLGIAAGGAVAGFCGYAIVFLTIYQNKFAVPVVRDQEDRGQVLIDTGLYGIVRHPMYIGLLIWFAGTALWLESYAGAIAVLVVFMALVPRILIEEKMLTESLAGYADYKARVRFRLVPFVW